MAERRAECRDAPHPPLSHGEETATRLRVRFEPCSRPLVLTTTSRGGYQRAWTLRVPRTLRCVPPGNGDIPLF